MTTNIGTISVDLEAKIARFEQNLQQATSSLQSNTAKMQRSLASVERGFGIVGKAAAGFLSALSAGVLIQFGAQALKAAAGLQAQAEQLGLSTDALQAYRYAASQSQVAVADMDGSVAKLTKKIGEAAQGNDEAIKAFQALGIKVLDAGGKVRSTESVFAELADKIAAIPDPARRAALAVKLMEEQGQKILPVLAGGSAGLARLSGEAAAAGAIVGNDLIQAAIKAEAKLDALAQRFKAVALAAAGQAAPALSSFIDWLERVVRSGTAEGQIDALSGRIEKLRSEALAALADANYFGAQFGDDPSTDTAQRAQAAIDRARELGQAMHRLIIEQARLREEFAKPVPLARAPGQAEGGAADPISTQVRRDIENAEKIIAEFRRKDLARTDPRQAFIEDAAAKLPKGATKEQAAEVRELAAAEYDRTEGLKQQNAEIDRYLDTVAEQNAAQAAMIKQRSDVDEASNQVTLSIQDEIEANQRLIEALGQGVQAYENAKAEIDILNRLKAAGVQLDDEQIARAKELAAQLGEQRKKIAEAEDGLRAQREAWGDLTRTITTGIEDAFLRGAKAADVLEAAMQDVLRILLRIAITKPFENAIGQLFQGGTGGGGGFGGFGGLGGIWSALFEWAKGPISAGSLAGSALVPGPGGGFFPALAEGGSFKVAGVGGIDSQFVGLRMTPGETLHAIPPGDDMGLAGDVIINNYSAERVSARRGSGPNGQQAVIVEVGRMAAQELRRPGSALHRASRETFNSSPNLARR